MGVEVEIEMEIEMEVEVERRGECADAALGFVSRSAAAELHNGDPTDPEAAPGVIRRRRDCHFTDTPLCIPIGNTLRTVQGGAIK